MPNDVTRRRDGDVAIEPGLPTEPTIKDVSLKGIRAIQGAAQAEAQETMPERVGYTDLSRDELQSALGRPFSAKESGGSGEATMDRMNRNAGREVLLSHPDKPSEQGFDGVAWSRKERQLCIQESKNFAAGSSVTADDLSAFAPEHLEQNLAEARHAISTSEVLNKREKISAQAQLRNRTFTVEVFVPNGVTVSESAKERLQSIGSDVTVREEHLDGRIIWSQQRKHAFRQLG